MKKKNKKNRRPLSRGLFPSEEVTDAEVKTLLALLDRDGDGHVTLREIIECVRALRSAASDGADEVRLRCARCTRFFRLGLRKACSAFLSTLV